MTKAIRVGDQDLPPSTLVWPVDDWKDQLGNVSGSPGVFWSGPIPLKQVYDGRHGRMPEPVRVALTRDGPWLEVEMPAARAERLERKIAELQQELEVALEPRVEEIGKVFGLRAEEPSKSAAGGMIDGPLYAAVRSSLEHALEALDAGALAAAHACASHAASLLNDPHAGGNTP